MRIRNALVAAGILGLLASPAFANPPAPTPYFDGGAGYHGWGGTVSAAGSITQSDNGGSAYSTDTTQGFANGFTGVQAGSGSNVISSGFQSGATNTSYTHTSGDAWGIGAGGSLAGAFGSFGGGGGN